MGQGLGFRVESLGFRVLGFWLEAQGLECRAGSGDSSKSRRDTQERGEHVF